MKHVIIDTNNLAYAAYHALHSQLTTDAPSAVLFGVLRSMFAYFEKYLSHAVCIFVFDPIYTEDTWRKRLLPSYKSSRTNYKTEKERLEKEAARQAVTAALTELRSIIQFMPVIHAERANTEADDIVAWLTTCHEAAGEETTIISGDEDFAQLVSPLTTIYNPRKNILINLNNFASVNKPGVVHPCAWLTYKTLVGDKSDDVPGIKGIGTKTAAALVNAAYTLRMQNYGTANHNTIMDLLLNSTNVVVTESQIKKAKSTITALAKSENLSILHDGVALMGLGSNSHAVAQMNMSEAPWVYSAGTYTPDHIMRWFQHHAFATLIEQMHIFNPMVLALMEKYR